MIAAAQIYLGRGAGGGGWVNPYVTDGLVAMWDGEWNVGPGVHDPNATMWKNLAGKNYDINCGNTGYFSGDAFIFTGAAGTIQNWEIGNESIGNLSVCGLSELNSFFAFTSSRYCGRMFAILPSSNRGFQFQTGRAAMFQDWYSDPWSVAANYDTILSDTFYNGELKPHTAGTSSWLSSSYGASIGYYGGNTYPYRGRIYNLRLYSRALTAEEIAANYAVDRARFNLP